jgi:CDP-diacylglycerol--glycerol-3-phosphate 3-phosphatidyltransferase
VNSRKNSRTAVETVTPEGGVSLLLRHTVGASSAGLPWPGVSEPILTWANGITALRSVTGIAPAVAALAAQSFPLLVTAYGVYWLLDIADGEAARRLDQETRTGAVFDIVADRASSLLCAACFVVLVPALAVPIAIYLIEFAAVDTMLSLGFLAFAVKGPNDMHLVDRTLWLWNWSRTAKALNTASVIVLCLAGQVVLASVVAAVAFVVKVWSCVRLLDIMARGAAAGA